MIQCLRTVTADLVAIIAFAILLLQKKKKPYPKHHYLVLREHKSSWLLEEPVRFYRARKYRNIVGFLISKADWHRWFSHCQWFMLWFSDTLVFRKLRATSNFFFLFWTMVELTWLEKYWLPSPFLQLFGESVWTSQVKNIFFCFLAHKIEKCKFLRRTTLSNIGWK